MKQRLLHLFAGAAATFLLQMAAGLLGPAGMLVSLLTPVPAALAGMLHGAAVGGGIVAVAAAAVLAAAGPTAFSIYLLQFGLGSIVLPLLLRRGWPWDRAVATALAVVMAASAAVAAGYIAQRGQQPTEAVQQYVRAEVDRTFEMLRTSDISESERAELATLAERSTELLTRIYPALAAVMAGATLLLTLWLLSALTAGRCPIAGTPFVLWKAPEPLVWLLIAGGFGLVLVEGWPKSVAMNLLTVLLPLYFLQGLAIVTYFFRKKGFSPLLRALGYFTLFVFNPFQLIVAGLGVFDLWFDFRKPRIKST